MLEKRELGLPKKLPAARELGKEIADMGVKISDRGRVSYGAWKAGEHDDVSGNCLSAFNALDSLESIKLGDFAFVFFSVHLCYKNFLSIFQSAFINTSDSETSKEIVVGEVERLKAGRDVERSSDWRNMFEDDVEERHQVF